MGKGSQCSSITCGRDCQGSCGWSSFWNRCLEGYTTTRSELNSGHGCTTPTTSLTTTTTPTTTLTTSTTPTTTPTTTLTTSLTTTTTPTTTLTTSLTTTTTPTTTLTTSTTQTTTPTTSTTSINLNLFNTPLTEENSYVYVSGIVVPLVIILITIFFIKRKKKNKVIIVNDRKEYINRMYQEHTVYDDVYEEPINSIEPYSVSDNNDVFYENPNNIDEEYEPVGNDYEYDSRIRSLENKKYEG